MDLTEELQRQADEAADQTPQAVQDVMSEAAHQIKAQHATNKPLREGDPIPDITLPDADGNTIHVNDLADTLVISFYRGGWCPYCNLELRALHEAHNMIRERGAELIAISPETPNHTEATQARHDLDFPVLSDHDNTVADEFGLVVTLPDELIEVYDNMGINLEATNGTDTNQLPLPATYIVDDGTITYAFINPVYKRRLDPKTILDQLRPTDS
jgi:peroxiredoxin